MMLAKAKLVLSITFIVLASFTIITYDHQNMFIIQATGYLSVDLVTQKKSFTTLAPDLDGPRASERRTKVERSFEKT